MKRGKVALLAALCALAALTAGAYTTRVKEGALEPETTPAVETPTLRERLEATQELSFDERGVWNLLLVGVDETENDETQRSDSMMLLSLDRARGRLTLVSLMRDIYCEIPGHGASRLNHAYMWGGVPLLEQTLEANFSMAADSYVQVDFEGFCAAIDAVGGVEIELDAQEAAYLGLPEGVNTLGGETALEYARTRSIGNADYDRTARQRNVLKALLSRAKELPMDSLRSLGQALLPAVTTDLSWGQILSLALAAREYADYELTTLRIPADGTVTDAVIDGMMVLEIDMESNRRLWREAVYGDENGAAG